MGVMRVLIFSLPRRLRDLAVRLAVGVDAVFSVGAVDGAWVEEGLGESVVGSTTRMVEPNVL
jgi:hypothetical protein